MRIIPLFFLVAFGTSLAVIYTYFLLIDWTALDAAYVSFSDISTSSTDLSSLFAAQAFQNIHRINVFAEGVWVLQSLILAAIGLHGLDQRFLLGVSLRSRTQEKERQANGYACHDKPPKDIRSCPSIARIARPSQGTD